MKNKNKIIKWNFSNFYIVNVKNLFLYGVYIIKIIIIYYNKIFVKKKILTQKNNFFSWSKIYI